MTPTTLAVKLKAQASSLNATILAVATAVGGLAVSLGVIGVNQQGIISATTVAGVALGGLIANAIHNGSIEPSAATTAILAFVGQVVSLAVSFAIISDAEAGTIIAVTTAVVAAAAQVAHAVLSKTVPA